MKKLLFVLFTLFRACSPAAAQNITVYPADTTQLNKNLFRASAVDVGFTGRYVARDATSQSYLNWVRPIGFTGLDMSGESTADYAHFFVIPGDGYNCNPLCPDQDGGKKFKKDFFHEWLTLCDSLGVKKGYVANVQTGNVDEVISLLDYGIDAVRWGGEQQLEENAQYYPKGGITYRDRINTWMDEVPGVYHIIDAAPSWLNSSRINREWNENLQGINGDAGRFYIWADEYTDGQTITSITGFWDDGITEYESGFSNQFPDHKIAVTQFGWKQTAPNINTGLNGIFLALGYIHFINNQDKYEYVSFQTLKSLESFANNYTALSLVGDLFEREYTVATTETIDGVYVATTVSGGDYATLIINSTGESKALSIKRDGKKVWAEGSGLSYQSPHDSSASVYAIDSTKTFTVLPYSINVLYH